MAGNVFEVAFEIGARLAGNFRRAFGGASDSLDRLARDQQRLEASTRSLARAQKLQAQGSAMASDAMGKLARNFAGAAAVVAPSAKAAIDFESAMADVKKVVDFDSPAELQQFSAELEKMSLEIPIAADGLAAIMAAAGQSGIAKTDLIEFTEQAAKMGVAFDITADQAGEMMAKWKSGMGLTLEDTIALADTANALSNANAANASQIGDVLMRYGALAKTAGLTEKQLAAMAATTIGAGASSETAATGIKAFMRAMSKGASMTGSQAEAFAGLGINPEQLQKDLQANAPKAIMDTLNTIQKLVPPERVTEILGVMFGDEAAIAIGPMMGNLDLLAENFKLAGDAAQTSGSMADEFTARSATTANSLELAKNAAMYAARAFGNHLLPTIRDLSARFVELADKSGAWIEENKSAVMTGLKVAGALIGINTAFHAVRLAAGLVIGPVMNVWKAFLFVQKGFLMLKSSAVVIAIFTKLGVAVRAVGAALKFAFVTNPWVLAIGAAIAAFAALVYWSKEIAAGWEWLKGKALSLWSTFAEKFPFISGLAQTAFGPIIVVVRTIIDIFVELINFVRNVFTGQWGAAWENCKNIFGAAWAGLKDLVKVPINGVIRMVNSAIGAINGINVDVPDWVPGMGGEKFGFNIPKIPELASGGIATRSTLANIGEGSEPEAVLPLSKLDNMLNVNGGGGGMTVTFAPVINVTGGDAYSQVKRGLDEGVNSLKKELERIQRNERRLSYS